MKPHATAIDFAQILLEAKKLPAPQDLRYVAFTIKTMLQTQKQLAKHVEEVQELCVVAHDKVHSNRLNIILNNGIKCGVSLLPNYPQVGISLPLLSSIRIR